MPDSGFLASQEETKPVESVPPVVEVPVSATEQVASSEPPIVGKDWDEDAVIEAQAVEEAQTAESAAEQAPDRFLERAVVGPTTSIAEAAQQDETQIEVARILEDGLGTFVLGLADAPQKVFLTKGAEVVSKIAAMVRAARFNEKEVVELVRAWLFALPAKSKPYLEQTTKIKIDGILALAHQMREDAKTKIAA